MGRKYFGTDGIRGKVGEFPITPEFVLRLGWAAGRVFSRRGKSKIVIGKDTRISGYMFESALEAGLSAAGVDSLLLGPMPTPAIAYMTRTFRADAGIVISASHNPFYDNGIKFFGSDGMKLPDDIEQAIEEELDRPVVLVESAKLGKAVRVNDAAGRYVEYCKGTVPHLMLSGMKIVLDCAHGATYDVAPKVFRELGAEVIKLGAEPDGLNINEQVGSTHPRALQAEVLRQAADLGIAFDGDGDRVLFVDKTGEIVDGDELLYVIAVHLQNKELLKGGVVGTLMTNLGLEVALQQKGIDLVRAKVGDRYVMEQLKEHDWILGGENSGHVVCRHVSTTGDGIVAALQVMQALSEGGMSLSEARDGMRKYPQEMINIKLKTKVDVLSLADVQSAVAQAESVLGSKGRVLLRPSGTEPLVRVMVEGENAKQVKDTCRSLANEVEKILSAV